MEEAEDLSEVMRDYILEIRMEVAGMLEDMEDSGISLQTKKEVRSKCEGILQDLTNQLHGDEEMIGDDEVRSQAMFIISSLQKVVAAQNSFEIKKYLDEILIPPEGYNLRENNMVKFTKEEIKQIIKEELEKVLIEEKSLEEGGLESLKKGAGKAAQITIDLLAGIADFMGAGAEMQEKKQALLTRLEDKNLSQNERESIMALLTLMEPPNF